MSAENSVRPCAILWMMAHSFLQLVAHHVEKQGVVGRHHRFDGAATMRGA
jgi:hypothetical protein